MAATGFLGFGTINNACATGLLTSDKFKGNVIVSPRNAEKAEALRAAHPKRVTIASDNQQVVDGSKIVFIAVLPSQAEATLGALKFSSNHTVISLMAGVPLDKLFSMLGGAVPLDQIVRAVPLPPVKDHAGVTVLTPPHPEGVRLFDLLGTAVPVGDEDTLSKLCVLTCMMGSYYQLLDSCHAFLVARGVDSAQASVYVGAQFASIALDGKHAGLRKEGFGGLIAEQTPGGFNEMGIRELREAGVWDEITATLGSIDARWQGKAKLSEKRPVTLRGAALRNLKQALAEAEAASSENKAAKTKAEMAVASTALSARAAADANSWAHLLGGVTIGIGLSWAAVQFSRTRSYGYFWLLATLH